MNEALFRATCKKYMELRHINTQEKLRAHTTCGSSTTFRKYWKDPTKLPLGIWEEIMSALNIPREEQFEILK
jgi:hypothetical protein